MRRGGSTSRDNPSLSDETTKIKFQEFVSSIENEGESAQAFYASATDPDEVAPLIEKIEKEVGPIHVAVYNIGAQVGNRTLERTSYRIFNMALRMGKCPMCVPCASPRAKPHHTRHEQRRHGVGIRRF